MRCMVIILGLVACSSKDTASSKPSGDPAPAPAPTAPSLGKLRTGDDVCDALTPDEVEAELHVKTIARKLPKSGEYSAPSCGWFVADAADGPDAKKVQVAMFIHDNAADSKQYFGEKLEGMCRLLPSGSGSAGSAGSGTGSDGGSGTGSDSGSASLSGPARGRALIGPNLGEDAAVCGSLWVLKGRTFFSLSPRMPTGTREQRIQVMRHLAERVLARVP